MYAAPQTPDGRIVKAAPSPGAASGSRSASREPADPAGWSGAGGRTSCSPPAAASPAWASTSLPASRLAWDGQAPCTSRPRCGPLVKAYGVAPLMADVLQPGVRVGRLVLCAPERRLSSEEIDQAVLANELQLPASYSIDFDGRFRIRPEGRVYDLAERAHACRRCARS